jgi:hypothetical protein
MTQSGIYLTPEEEKTLISELARRNFKDFVAHTKPDYEFNWHHITICNKLDEFAKGKIRKLMLFVPPQHGKSELATRRFPAYQLGIDPKCKIAVCSYSATLAAAFNRDIQRVIDNEKYHDVFPDTILNESNVATSALGSYLRNSEIFEIVGHRGFVKTVGVGGSLTGTPVDVGIIDDPFKDREEAMSVRIRDKVYSWYTDVFSTRLHNDSQQLIIMTRWDQDDLCGRILATENDWQVLTFQAIKEKDMPGDPRQHGEPLWENRHSLERLLHIKETSPFTFNSLYQQEPKVSKEALVLPEWNYYDEEPNIYPVYGLDFGFSNDPSALIQVKRHNKRLYLRQLVYRKGLLNSELITLIKQYVPVGSKIIADSAEPKSIEEIRRAGINISPSVKGPDSVVNTLSWLRDHEIYIHKDSHDLVNELNNYQWVMHGGDATNIPIDSFNHLIDAARYTKIHFNVPTTLGVTFHR